jgi:hypothetical protein
LRAGVDDRQQRSQALALKLHGFGFEDQDLRDRVFDDLAEQVIGADQARDDAAPVGLVADSAV